MPSSIQQISFSKTHLRCLETPIATALTNFAFRCNVLLPTRQLVINNSREVSYWLLLVIKGKEGFLPIPVITEDISQFLRRSLKLRILLLLFITSFSFLKPCYSKGKHSIDLSLRFLSDLTAPRGNMARLSPKLDSINCNDDWPSFG